MAKAPAGGRRSRPGALCAVLAALVYLALALAFLSPALRAPHRLLPQLAALSTAGQGPRITMLDRRDQKMVVAVTARNANLLSSRPWALLGDGQCYPLPSAYTLGEHMFGLGLLAAIPWALTHDPIASFNVALVLTLWVPALTMYALALYFTRSAAAAFVAGLLFAAHPGRISDPSHPYVHGDLWAPLALLFLHRAFTRGRWRDVAGWVAFTGLALLESPYPLAALGLLLAAYLPYLVVRHRARLRLVAPRLAVGTVAILAVGWFVLGPYLETRATWQLLGDRVSALVGVRAWLPGGYRFPGFLTVALAVLALLDRLRRRRPVDGEDPRLAYLAGAVLIVWSTVSALSPLELARQLLPGLDALRVLPAIGIGAGLPLSFLAGFGALALLEHRRRSSMVALVTVLVAFVIPSRLHPALARLEFGVDSFAMTAYDARPPEADVALVRAHVRGAVLDVPFAWHGAKRLGMAEDLLRASYRPGPTAACYNSFVSPVQEQIGVLAAAFPESSAVDALAALGFDTAVVERQQLLAPERLRLEQLLRRNDGSRVRLLGKTSTLAAYRLTSPPPVRRDVAMLHAVPDDAMVDASPVHGTLPVSLTLRNGGTDTFRHPDPIAPTALRVRWYAASGTAVHEEQVRVLLPLALAAGAQHSLDLSLTAPAASGTYAVRVELAADPGRVLGTRTVRLSGADPTPPAGG